MGHHRHFIKMPSKKHSKVTTNGKSTCISPAVHMHPQVSTWGQINHSSTLWTCWKSSGTTFWIFQWVLQDKKKKKKVWWYLARYNAPEGAFSRTSVAPAGWADRAGSNHPTCPRGDTGHWAEGLGSWKDLPITSSPTGSTSKQAARRLNSGWLQAQ